MKIRHPDGSNKLTIYSKINRDNETAILEGIGPLGKHVFTLNIKSNLYELNDRINNKNISGNIEEFTLIPLTKEFIFKKLDINEPQPIIIKEEQKNIEVEINIVKQEEL